MRRIAWAIVALTSLLPDGLLLQSGRAEETAATSEAEQPPPRDPSVLVRLIRSEAVQRELQCKREQRKALEALVEEVEYPLFLLRDRPAEAKREPLEAIADRVEAGLQTLNGEQRQRLLEIVLRAHGWPAVLAPQQVEALGLSDQQVADIRRILEQAASDGAGGEGLDKQILPLLTPEQKRKLTAMTGAPFDFSKVPQVACQAPELRDVAEWINTEPLTLESLRGRVVVLHFFAFACSNCIKNQPHYKSWHDRYAGKDVTVLGIHTPETSRERNISNLRADVEARELRYPIAVDAQASNWAAWGNQWWPSVYLIDRRGKVRYWWYGELNWQGAEGEAFMRTKIDELLAERD